MRTTVASSGGGLKSRVTPGRPAADPAWVRALFLAPAVVGSFAALVLLGRSGGLRRWLGRPPVADEGDADLDALRRSIVGQGKRRVTALFGPAPAATSAPTVTWYYPVPRARRRTAMAISFAGEIATAVEFFHPPARAEAAAGPTA